MAGVHRREAEKLARLFAIVSDPSRMLILRAIAVRGGANVRSVCKQSNMSQSAVSHQLQKLLAWGVVKAKREGRIATYTLAPTPLGRQVARLLRFK